MLLYEDHNKSVVYALAFSPDGSELASGARDGSLLLHEADGSAHPVTERGPKSPAIYSVGYLPDGSAVVIGHAQGWHVYRRVAGTPRVHSVRRFARTLKCHLRANFAAHTYRRSPVSGSVSVHSISMVRAPGSRRYNPGVGR